MKALILNSGLGSRMGEVTKKQPKCLTLINNEETILSRQIKILKDKGINKFVITTGAHSKELIKYVNFKFPNIDVEFVYNDKYAITNYIYSIYLTEKYVLNDDIILLHGDLVFEPDVINKILQKRETNVVISSKEKLPQKDFKAIIDNEKVIGIGINFFDKAVACQPLYKLNNCDWKIWFDEIKKFCNNENVKVYAEDALNNVINNMYMVKNDVEDMICREVDTIEDLIAVKRQLEGGK